MQIRLRTLPQIVNILQCELRNGGIEIPIKRNKTHNQFTDDSDLKIVLVATITGELVLSKCPSEKRTIKLENGMKFIIKNENEFFIQK